LITFGVNKKAGLRRLSFYVERCCTSYFKTNLNLTDTVSNK
jgi:hypothetical protein